MMATKRTTDIDAYNAMKAKLFGDDNITDDEYYYQNDIAPSAKAEKRSNYTANAKDIKPRSSKQTIASSNNSFKNHPNAPPTAREYYQRKRQIFGSDATTYNQRKLQQKYHRHHKTRGAHTNNHRLYVENDTVSYFQPHSKQKHVQPQKQSKKKKYPKFPKYQKIENKSVVPKNEKSESKTKTTIKKQQESKEEVGKVYANYNGKLGKKSYYIKKGEKPMIKGTFTPQDIDEKLAPKQTSPKHKRTKSADSARGRGRGRGRSNGRGRGRGRGKRYTLADSKFLSMLASKEMNPFLTEKAQKESDQVLDYMDEFNKNEAVNDWWQQNEEVDVKEESENEEENEKEEVEIANAEAADSENECEQNKDIKHEITHYLASMKAQKLMNQYNVPPPVIKIEAKKPEIDSLAMKKASEMIQRREWRLGDNVCIFSMSKQCWCDGKIIKISNTQSAKEWKIGTNCNIFSKSQQKWFQGNVTKVFMENDEQHLEVNYNGYTKQVKGDDCEVIKFVEVDESKGEWLTVIYENTSKVISRYHQNIRPMDAVTEQNGVQEKALEYLAQHMPESKQAAKLSPSRNVIQSPTNPMEYDQQQQAQIDQMMAYNQQLYNLSLASMQTQTNAFPLSPTSNYNGSNNVYVKGLSPLVDDAELMQIFSKFGKIISAKIKYDKYGKSRCFGFVLFESSENAQSAISAMTNVMHRGKMLYVTQYQPKEFRKSFLKNQMQMTQSNGMDQSASICWDFNTMRGCQKDKKCKWKHEYFDGKTFHPISGELLDGTAARIFREANKTNTAK